MLSDFRKYLDGVFNALELAIVCSLIPVHSLPNDKPTHAWCPHGCTSYCHPNIGVWGMGQNVGELGGGGGADHMF